MKKKCETIQFCIKILYRTTIRTTPECLGYIEHNAERLGYRENNNIETDRLKHFQRLLSSSLNTLP